MKYKIMIIDDSLHERQGDYEKALSPDKFELVVIKNYQELLGRYSKVPVDGYIIDVVLDQGSWEEVGDAGSLLAELGPPPRPTPVFLVSIDWGQPSTMDALNIIRKLNHLDVLQYFVWDDFQKAAVSMESPIFETLNLKLFEELSIWHQRSTFHPKEHENIRILVLADLQYEDAHASEKAVSCEQSVASVLYQHNRVPDIVVLAGDIAFSGASSEFSIAKNRLEKYLLEELWPGISLDKMRDRILVVPGNHDVNLRYLASNHYKWKRKNPEENIEGSWEKLVPCPQDFSVKDDLNALEPFRSFAENFAGSKISPVSSHVDRRFEASGLRFFLINSSLLSSIDKPALVGFGEEAYETIRKSLGSKDNPSEFFNIVVSHHGIQTGPTEQVQMSDWDAIGKQFFKNCHISLWIFGHYHKAKASKEDINPRVVNLVQAPTLRIDPKKESVNRGFTLIELDRSKGKVTGGNVYFYQFDGDGVVIDEPECKSLTIEKV